MEEQTMMYLDSLLDDFRMFRELWKVVAADCRTKLISEFIFEPGKLRCRYSSEVTFRRNMDLHWLKH